MDSEEAKMISISGMILFKWVLVISGTVLLGTVVFMLGSAVGNAIKAQLRSETSDNASMSNIP